MPGTLPEALVPLAAWLAANFPGVIPATLIIESNRGEQFRLPFVVAPPTTPAHQQPPRASP